MHGGTKGSNPREKQHTLPSPSYMSGLREGMSPNTLNLLLRISYHTFARPHPFLSPVSSGGQMNNKRRANKKNDNKAHVDDHVPPGVELVKLFGDGWIARSSLLFLQESNGTVQATQLAVRPTLHAVTTA